MPKINFNDLNDEYSQFEKIPKGEKILSNKDEYQIIKKIKKHSKQ